MSALASSLATLTEWLDSHPGELPDDGEAIVAIHDLLGDRPEQLRNAFIVERAHRERPDLAALVSSSGGVIAAPRDASLITPLENWQRRLANLERMNAPDVVLEHTRLEVARVESEPQPALEWHRAIHLPTAAADFPALARFAALTLACADHAAAVWRHHHPDDDRPLRLASALAAISSGFSPAAATFALRDELERETYRADPALAALRALVLAFDYLTDNPARCEQTELPYLCAFAWAEGPAVIPAPLLALAPDPAVACFRWWIATIATITGHNPHPSVSTLT